MVQHCKCSHSQYKHVDNNGPCKANLLCSCTSYVSDGKKSPWDGAYTLEDYFRKLLSDGLTDEAVDLMQKLPESVRARYRSIYVEHRQSKKNGKT